ncbi:MAG TPA: NADH:ubiquinone oxidoreductase, partial [Thermoplasmatales archaeon]|nr:NADH:ubiquinone oxidoreductase [Thermoplasmatales archaeon]
MNILDILLQQSPALIVATPLLGAFLTPLIGKLGYNVRNIFIIIILAVTAFLVFLLASDVFSGNIHTYVFGGTTSTVLSNTVIRILFEVDGLSIFMAIITVILSLAAVIYSWAFMREETGQDKYYTLLLLMTTGMFGMVLTGDLFNFFVFLEITSIASCALIAFWTHKAKAVEAAFNYMVISTIGALFVLLSIAFLYGKYDALNIAKLASRITPVSFSFIDKLSLILLLAALTMKAGIAPMHMWLPDAYGRAPASISIILVGATQASLYGVFRICFTLYGNVIQIPEVSLGWIMVILGLITMLIGVFMAMIQIDFKKLIAYGALAELGYMFLGVGTGLTILSNPQLSLASNSFALQAMKGGIFHIINDALDVGLLFLVAGAVYYATKESSLNNLGGIARNMKYTTVFFLIGLLAVSGIPPMNGFASKLLIYESVYQLNPILAIIAILASIMLLAIMVKVFYSAFLGPKIDRFQDIREAPKSMLIAMGILASLIIFFGLFPDLIVNTLVEPAVKAITHPTSYI